MENKMKLYYGYTKEVHELAERYIQREILCCDSSFISDLMKQSYDSATNEASSQFTCDFIVNFPESEIEIYEWYRVSQWLAEKLIAQGESVLSNNYGYWWGRTCTGQSIILDGTIQEIAKAIV